ncbi:unnamed protein product [marine sediment metagenome]|uniref:O-antigen ligase-related domain-containing protein n=1 Tax=marine sediment metagenome TaxID=412755 RepID=X1G868_9ZZZZ
MGESEFTDIRSIDHRVFQIRAAWEMFLDNPLLGVGFGGFREHYSDYSPFYDSRSVAHNVFMNSIAEMGVFGGLATLMIYVFVIRDLWRARNKQTAHNTRTIDFMLALVIGVNIVNALLHGKYFSREMFIVFAWALIAADLLRQEEEPRTIYQDGFVKS